MQLKSGFIVSTHAPHRSPLPDSTPQLPFSLSRTLPPQPWPRTRPMPPPRDPPQRPPPRDLPAPPEGSADAAPAAATAGAKAAEALLPSLSIWPPSQRTRDAVVRRLVQTLAAPSVFSQRYGAGPEPKAERAAVEAEAFARPRHTGSSRRTRSLASIAMGARELPSPPAAMVLAARRRHLAQLDAHTGGVAMEDEEHWRSKRWLMGQGMAPFLLGSGSAISSTLIHLQHVLVTSAGSNDGRKKQSIRQAALTHFTKAVVITNLKLTAQIWRSTLKIG
ncbi:hypothetical protein BDA96_05G086500 [Sorghum bicolor]|uniref:WPP domain-containing protein n=1 Tax=Sorghum bicolor TaxID=4558 RepID=A0A921QYT2_SORBI|nr:hypothetical protein BDA96_05G086500 [Sorghum bicolor]